MEVSRTLIELRRCKGFIIKDWEEELSHFRFDYENSVKRRKQQDLLFRSLGLGQQEEKQLQSKLQSIQEALTLIGSPDSRRSYGQRYPLDQMVAEMNAAIEAKPAMLLPSGVTLASRCGQEEVNLTRDMKEEHKRIIAELGVAELKNKSFRVQRELMLLKQRVAVLLMGKKCKADYGLIKLPDKPVKRWNTMESKPEVEHFRGIER